MDNSQRPGTNPMENKLRKITINNQVYFWRRTHQHLAACKPSRCVEKVVIYLEGHKKSPLQLLASKRWRHVAGNENKTLRLSNLGKSISVARYLEPADDDWSIK